MDTNLQKRLQILRDEHAKREMETTLRLDYEVASTPITSPVHLTLQCKIYNDELRDFPLTFYIDK